MARKKIDRKDKRLYLDFVWLSDGEYTHLCSIMGEKKVLDWIMDLNLYLGAKGDKYESHYYTIMMWERRAKTTTHLSPSPTSPTRGEATAEKCAADRILEALRDPANRIMPSFEEKTKAALFAVLTRRRIRWPELFEMRHDTTYMEEIHAEIIKEYSASTPSGGTQ